LLLQLLLSSADSSLQLIFCWALHTTCTRHMSWLSRQ
jgi:hypothetical protein